MSVDQAFNFKRIDKQVATAGVLSEEQLSQLRANGYQAVINLLPDDSEYAVKDEQTIVRQQRLDYLYIPVDFNAPADRDYRAFVRALESCGNKSLLIHCAANYRVSAFYAIYAHQNLGWSGTRAKQHIASIWSLADYPQWYEFVSNYIDG